MQHSKQSVPVSHTCVLLYSGEGLLEGVSSGGALGGVGRQAVGVHSLHSGVSVGLMRNAGESIDDGRDDAGHGGRGDVGWWRTEACWEKHIYCYWIMRPLFA